MYSNLSPLHKFLQFQAIPFVWGIIYVVVSCFWTYYYSNTLAFSSHPILKSLSSLVFFFLATMTGICHIYCIVTHPGEIDYSIVSHLKEKEKTFCKKCNKDRPIKAHHCSTCGICILKMDHHCPWVFNCVGHKNQKYFFLFLMYGTLGDLLAFLCIGSRIFTREFVDSIIHPDLRIRRRSTKWEIYMAILFALKKPLWIIFGTCLALAMSISIGSLWARQIYLLSRNITNIDGEMWEEDEDCPYYAYRDRWFMFRTVMGLGAKWKMLFPIFEYNKYNDGYKFLLPFPSKKIDTSNRKPRKWYQCKCGICCC